METDPFSDWLSLRSMISFTFARGLSWQQMLEGFEIDPESAKPETHLSALQAGSPRVRVGNVADWAYAIEASSVQGSADGPLKRLSFAGGEAFNLTYSETIQTFMYFADGERVCGFDLVAPAIRWGYDQHRFDASMEAAGLLKPSQPPSVTGARFVRLAFGITLDPVMVERELPSAAVRGR